MTWCTKKQCFTSRLPIFATKTLSRRLCNVVPATYVWHSFVPPILCFLYIFNMQQRIMHDAYFQFSKTKKITKNSHFSLTIFKKAQYTRWDENIRFQAQKHTKEGGRADTRYKKSDILSALTIKQGRRIPVCQYLRYWLFWQLFFYGCCYRHCSQKLAVV